MSKLEILDWKATFVDVGSERMHVSIGGGEVKVFMTFTSDLSLCAGRGRQSIY